MTREEALRYVGAYAQHVRADTRALRDTPEGGFFGDLGAAEVEFDPGRGALIVRGMVFRGAQGLVGRRGLDELLREVEANEAADLAGGRFELAVTPAHADEGAWLNLRRDFTEADLSEEVLVAQIKALTAAAYTFRRSRLIPMLEELNRREGRG